MRVSDDEKCYIDFWIRIIFVWKSHQIIFLYSVETSAFPVSLVSVWVGRFIFVSSFLTLPKERRLLSKPCLIPLIPERWARREIVHISFKSRESLPTLSDTQAFECWRHQYASRQLRKDLRRGSTGESPVYKEVITGRLRFLAWNGAVSVYYLSCSDTACLRYTRPLSVNTKSNCVSRV